MRRIYLQLTQTIGLVVRWLIRKAGLGNGSVLPGRLVLLLNPTFLTQLRPWLTRGCLFITGTNGKSTTTYYLTQVLRSLGYSVAANESGANMTAGLAAACLTLHQPVDFGIFEVDEAALPNVSRQLVPTHVIALNFSRDQLDRYTEIETIINRLIQSLSQTKAKLVYNAGNPYAAVLGQALPAAIGYQIASRVCPVAIDLPVCSHCWSSILTLDPAGVLRCEKCGYSGQLPKTVGQYHSGLLRIFGQVVGAPTLELAETLTATLAAIQSLAINVGSAVQAVQRIQPLPAHEKHWQLNEMTKVELVLAKNPESFNRQLRRRDFKAESLVIIAVNRHYADGLDTSWLWDVYFERLAKLNWPITVTGEAAADLVVRFKAAGLSAGQPVELTDLSSFLAQRSGQILILANYTAYRSIEKLLDQTAQQVVSADQEVATEMDPSYA